MIVNAKGSELIALLASANPVSQGAGTLSTGWVPMKNVHRMMALVSTGVLGASATVDAKLQQAQDSSGTGAKDITNKSITQLVKASNDNNQAIINLLDQELDTEGAFTHVRLSITVGTAASLVAGYLFGVAPRFADASALNQAGVVQVVA